MWERTVQNVTVLVFATGPSLNLQEPLPMSWNHYTNYSRWPQMMNAQYIGIFINGASTICGFEGRYVNSDLFSLMHNQCISSLCRQMGQLHRHYPILRMSVNVDSTMFRFISWIFYIPIGCSDPFFRDWQRLLGKTSAAYSLQHPENERQWIVNSFSCCIFGKQGIPQIFAFTTGLLTALIDEHTIYQR